MPIRLLPLLVTLVWLPCALAGGGPENVLVLVNDASPESLAVAHHYLQRRDVPRHHVVHLHLPKTRWGALRAYTEYETLIEAPVKAWRTAHPASPITTLVLCRHVPVVVGLKPPADPKAKVRDRSRSIAHLLSVMDVKIPGMRTAGAPAPAGLRHPQGGPRFWANPYVLALARTRRAMAVDPRRPLTVAGQPYPLFGVTALNAYTVADAKALVDRALAAEQRRPDDRRGLVLLGRSRTEPKKDPRGMYNGDFPGLQAGLQQAGFKVEIVPHPGTSSKLLTGRKDVLAYQFGQAGWDPTFPATNTYLPGALIDNLTSVALTERCFDPAQKKGQTSMCHFLAAGASAVHGCVREPYTIAFSPTHTHLRAYLWGYSLIESYLLAHPVMPWMNLVAGDPLMQPFAVRPRVEVDGPTAVDGGLRVAAKASARRGQARIATLALYVDGRLRETAAADHATWTLTDVDPDVSHLAVVATDDSPFATQGRWDHRPRAASANAQAIAFEGIRDGTLRFAIARRPVVFSWYAPAATPPFGTQRGTSLALTPTGGARATVEIWLAAPPTAAPAVKYFDIGAQLVSAALSDGAQASRRKDAAALARAVAVLRTLPLDAGQTATVDGWAREADALVTAEWGRLQRRVGARPSPEDLEALAAFAARHPGRPEGKAARARVDQLRATADAAATPAWKHAELLRAGGSWLAALARYQEIVRRWPASRHARPARAAIKAIEAEPAAQAALKAARDDAAAARLWRMAESYRRNGQTGRAAETLRSIIARYPGTESARKARRRLGD